MNLLQDAARSTFPRVDSIAQELKKLATLDTSVEAFNQTLERTDIPVRIRYMADGRNGEPPCHIKMKRDVGLPFLEIGTPQEILYDVSVSSDLQALDVRQSCKRHDTKKDHLGVSVDDLIKLLITGLDSMLEPNEKYRLGFALMQPENKAPAPPEPKKDDIAPLRGN